MKKGKIRSTMSETKVARPLRLCLRLVDEVSWGQSFCTDRKAQGASSAIHRGAREEEGGQGRNPDQTENSSSSRLSAGDSLCTPSTDLLRGSIGHTFPQRDRYRDEEDSEDGRVDREQQKDRHCRANESGDQVRRSETHRHRLHRLRGLRSEAEGGVQGADPEEVRSRSVQGIGLRERHDTRIRAKWAPPESDTEEPRYRKVQAPTTKAPRSASAPVRQEHVVSPLEFDTGPPVLKRQTSMTQLRDEGRATQVKRDVCSGQEEVLKPGSPPARWLSSPRFRSCISL